MRVYRDGGWQCVALSIVISEGMLNEYSVLRLYLVKHNGE